jgi:hypothetical protein
MKKKITGMQIQNIANSNAGKWRDIGIKLDVRNPQLDICEEGAKNRADCLRCVLIAWRTKETWPTVERLLQASRRADCSGTVTRALTGGNTLADDNSRRTR